MISRNLYKACFSCQNCRFLPKSSFLFQHKDRILLSYSRLIRNPIFVYHASEAVDQGPFIRVLKKIFTPLSQVLGMLYRSQASGVLLCGGRDSTKYFFVIFFLPGMYSCVVRHTSHIQRFLKCPWSTWSSSNIYILQISNFYFWICFHCDFSCDFPASKQDTSKAFSRSRNKKKKNRMSQA